MAETVYVLNDNILEVDGLVNAATSKYINDATVTVTLVNKDNEDVIGAVNLTLDYVSDGRYRTTLADTLLLTAQDFYTAKVTADGGAGLKGYWEIAVLAETRTS